ncbi:GNAT family N-acetyltransferase [Granulibacter bethesdensis]|uniref:L-ornithine N(alpha)-acyltransferase n=1 Tax=Granulibacter bethesdensis TaxID=364410 RepID=A0AAN0VEZ9_9PROT|nr:GNAT family N-acyltransferase [Granulibacter bethesdensis]AHJ62159.1 putative cytosolic protein [Granulibacter bethesdensis]AHJ64784.1 putative cytosolic protein [Granulibacter bethesdensis CGDNIH4]APH58699.1 putative cytosolic protein [Granulibacter bethesdensis]
MTAETPLGIATRSERSFGELRAGNLGVRIAESQSEIIAAQALRYRVFYEEMGAEPAPAIRRDRLDRDEFDPVADHLLVIDHERGSGPEAIVGTYRLIQDADAHKVGRFYTSNEYDISILTSFPGKLLELGRSCIASDYRGRAAMQLMWRGIAAYIFLHQIDLMFGCASLPGTNVEALSTELTYLYRNHLAPPGLRPRALESRYIDMRRLDPVELDIRRAQAMLPPLIKGYLRLGGFIGDGAVVDTEFNTTDVAVVVKTDLITDKYYRHYERQLRDALT